MIAFIGFATNDVRRTGAGIVDGMKRIFARSGLRKGCQVEIFGFALCRDSH